MLDLFRRKVLSSQLIGLQVPILPRESFPTTFAQPLSDEIEITRNGQFRTLQKATASLKHSNAVPQAKEIETIEVFQKNCSADVSQDDGYIQHLQSQINDLLEELQATRSRQSRIQKMLDYFKPVCSPVRHLPPEILIMIFQFCLPTDAGPYSRALLVLCHVSSLWRSVALASQQLWSRLFFDFSRSSASKHDEISQFWLLHSKSQPRSLHYCHNSLHGRQPDLQQWSEDLKTSSMLLRTLKCIHIHPQNLLPFLQLPSSDVPLLEAVHLASTERCHEVITVLETAPRLRVVHLDLFLRTSQTTLPWSRLTWIKIHNFMNAAAWTVAFQQCLQLQYGSFDIYFPPLGDFTSTPQTTLEHLKTLCLTVDDDANLFQGYFQNFNLPSLQHLSLSGDSFGDEFNMPFCDMTPCPHLVSLCLEGIYVEQGGLASLYMATPKLECLALDASIDYPSISALLQRNRAVLPNLSRLYLIILYDDFTQDPRVVCSAITSRFHNSSSISVSLKHVSLFILRHRIGANGGSGDEEDDDFGFTAADRVAKASTVIMNDPHSNGVDLQISIVHKTPKLADIVEEIWCKWPQDY